MFPSSMNPGFYPVADLNMLLKKAIWFSAITYFF